MNKLNVSAKCKTITNKNVSSDYSFLAAKVLIHTYIISHVTGRIKILVFLMNGFQEFVMMMLSCNTKEEEHKTVKD